MRAMSEFSGDLTCSNINCPTPGGLVEIKSPLPLLHQPRDLTTRVHVLPDITVVSLYIEESPPYPAPRGYLLNQNPTMPPLCPAGGVVGTDIDRCITVNGKIGVPAHAVRYACRNSFSHRALLRPAPMACIRSFHFMS